MVPLPLYVQAGSQTLSAAGGSVQWGSRVTAGFGSPQAQAGRLSRLGFWIGEPSLQQLTGATGTLKTHMERFYTPGAELPPDTFPGSCKVGSLIAEDTNVGQQVTSQGHRTDNDTAR